MRHSGDKVSIANHLPADDDVNAAVDDYSICGFPTPGLGRPIDLHPGRDIS